MIMSDPEQIESASQIKESADILTKRFLKRLMGQNKDDLMVVLSRMFPHAQAMRILALSEDLANERPTAEQGLHYLFQNEVYNLEMIQLIRRSVPNVFSEHLVLTTPTEFYVRIKCTRTPLKEFFDECRDYSCETCILSRIHYWKPFQPQMEKVEDRRSDLCKNCGKLLTKKDDIEVKNERVYYRCSSCKHRGWNSL